MKPLAPRDVRHGRPAGDLEAFLIENGKIRRVEMIGPSAFFHIQAPWPGGLS